MASSAFNVAMFGQYADALEIAEGLRLHLRNFLAVKAERRSAFDL
jgi:hypothetical protein